MITVITEYVVSFAIAYGIIFVVHRNRYPEPFTPGLKKKRLWLSAVIALAAVFVFIFSGSNNPNMLR